MKGIKAPAGFKICASKTCSQKGMLQPVDSFTLDRRAYDGRSCYCSDCQYRYRNSKEYKERSRARNERVTILRRAKKQEKARRDDFCNFWQNPVEAIRETLGWSHAKLAEELWVSAPTLHRWKEGFPSTLGGKAKRQVMRTVDKAIIQLKSEGCNAAMYKLHELCDSHNVPIGYKAAIILQDPDKELDEGELDGLTREDYRL